MTHWRVTLAASAAALAMTVAAGGAAGGELELIIEFANPPEVTVTEAEEADLDEAFAGSYAGTVSSDSDSMLAGAEVNCEFEGYTFSARGFACGSTTTAEVSGRCLFTTSEGDTAIAEWDCGTTEVTLPGARCHGTATWIEGIGKLAGIAGEAEVDSDPLFNPKQGYAQWRGTWGVPRLTLLAE
jgi:hypothetical protein